MRASVVVPVYNGEAILVRCLDALASQTIPHSDYEIIVVDDGSTDATSRIVDDWHALHPSVNIRLIRQENAGPAAARNRGATEAGAPLLFFTDADCAPERDWIEQMVLAFATADVAGAKGVYLSDQKGLVPRFVQAEYEDRYDRMRGRERIDFVDTYSAGYRRDIFLENGGFDPIFPTASVEDQEFSFRLAEKGYRLVFAPEARVRHIHDESLREYARRKYLIGYWKALVTRRYPQRIVRDSHTPQVLKAQIVTAAGLIAVVAASLVAIRIARLRVAWRLLSAFTALFMVLSTPFLIKLAQRSWKLALAGPFLLFLRALALGGGYLVGGVRFGRSEDTRNEFANEG